MSSSSGRARCQPVISTTCTRITALESSFSVSNLVIMDNQPKILNLHGLLGKLRPPPDRSDPAQVRVRPEEGAGEGPHPRRAPDCPFKIDAIIKAIRASDTVDNARAALIAQFGLDEPQANAILQMQLRRLAALEQQKITDEKKGLGSGDRPARDHPFQRSKHQGRDPARDPEVAAKFGDKRRTQIALDTSDLSNEDLIEDKNVLVSITTANYIKRIDLDTYRKQRRGGHGITGMTTKEEDLVESVFVAGMKDYLLCFTNLGRVYWLKVYQIPESSRVAKGKPIVNLLNLKDEIVTTVIPISEFRADRFLLFATRFGQAIKIQLDQFSNPRSTGTNAIRIRENDQLVDVILTDGTKELILTTRFGQSLRFHEETVRTVGRDAQGVRG